MNFAKKCFFVTLIIFAIAIFSNFSFAKNESEPAKPEPRVQRISGLNAKFIVALIDDGQGGAWIGTEDEGVSGGRQKLDQKWSCIRCMI